MTWLRRHGGAIYLTVLMVALSAGSYWLAAHALIASQHQWCTTLNLLTSRPVPKPSDPAANPSREQSYTFYTNLVELRHHYGCG